VKGHLHLIAEFFPADVLEGKDTKRIDAKTVSIRHIHLLIALQRANGSFESDQRIAKLFNYSSIEELILSFHSSTSDEQLKKLDKSIIVSVFITSFLRALLWKHKSEWISSYTKTETWISESINDVEIEESLYAEVNRYAITSRNEKAKNINKALELLRRRQSPFDALSQSKSFVVSFLIKAKQVHTSSTPILLIRVNRNSAKRSADPLLILFQSRQTRCPYLQYGNSSLVLRIYHGRSQRQMGNYIQEVVRLVKCTNYQQRNRKRASRSGKNIRCQVDEETLRLDEPFKSSLTITEGTVSEEVKKKLEKIQELLR